MWSIFKPNQKTRLGVDIGASSIKIVELEREKEGFKLKNYGLVFIDDYLKEKGEEPEKEILDKQAIEIIQNILQEARFNTSEANISIPVYSMFSTLIEMPKIPLKEIAAAIPFEARKYIPVPINDVVLDWSIVNESKKEEPVKVVPKEAAKEKPQNEEIKKEPNKTELNKILLIAVLKEAINRHTRIVQNSKLKVGFVEAETFSAARSLVGNDKSQIIVIDIGGRASSISIMDKGFMRLTRNFEIGGKEIAKSVAQAQGISLAQADALEAKPLAQVSAVLDNIIAEINKIVNFYQTKNQAKIDKCILTGGVSRIAEVAQYFEDKLGLETSIGNPFARIAYPKQLEPILKKIGPTMSVAVGLAMKDY